MTILLKLRKFKSKITVKKLRFISPDWNVLHRIATNSIRFWLTYQYEVPEWYKSAKKTIT